MQEENEQISPAATGEGSDLPPVVEDEKPVEGFDELIARGVEGWVAAYIRNSPMSRNTSAYNHLMASLPGLPSFIRKELGI